MTSLLLFSLLALVDAGAPESKLGEIRARGKLVISVKNLGVSSPSAHKDPAHFQKRGFELELAGALARRIVGDASRIQVKLLPRVGRLYALEENGVDLVISMIPIPDGAQPTAIAFSHPYYAGGLALLVKADAPYRKLADLRGKRIGAGRATVHDTGGEIEEIARRQGVRLTVERFSNFAAAAKALAEGRVDAMVSLNVNLAAFAAEHPGEFRQLEGLLTRVRYGVAVRKVDRDLLREVNEVVDSMTRSGELARLAEKWKLPPAERLR